MLSQDRADGFRNALLVARREFRVRVRSRAFALSTLLLAAVAGLMGLAPIAVTAMDRGAVVRIAVASPDPALAGLGARTLDAVLNGSVAIDPTASVPYRIVVASDAPTARADVAAGRLDGLLVVTRNAANQLDFRYVTRAPSGRQAILFQILTVAVATSVRAGEAQGLVHSYVVEGVGAAAPAPGETEAERTSRAILATMLAVVIVITSVTYGMWVATAVVEEKASRVIEVLLRAAAPGELLAGKVIGVGAAGLTQMIAIVAAGLTALALEGPISALVLGTGAAPPIGGFTPGLLAAFLLFFVLGFGLSALLYAAAGALVSRQDDVQQVALPMILVSFVGYFAAVAATATPDASWVAPLSWVPLVSPYLMMTRLATGPVPVWEVGLASALLVAASILALRLAIRLYAAGVLRAGQRLTLRSALGLRPAGPRRRA